MNPVVDVAEIAKDRQARQVIQMRLTVEEKQLERLRAMTPEEKIRASEALRRSVWELKAAWFRSTRPEWTEVAVQDAVRHWIGGAAS